MKMPLQNYVGLDVVAAEGQPPIVQFTENRRTVEFVAKPQPGVSNVTTPTPA